MHVTASNSKYSCERCLKSLKSLTTLRRHTEVCSNSNSEPRFICEICEKRFRTSLQCSRHLQYTHRERLFTCEKSACGRAFSSKSHLLDHMVTHTTDRPFSCPFKGCEYRARTHRRLVQHKVIHGEGRRFSCDYCDYSASTSSNLRRHARIHAGSRPYLCPHCDHRTSELDALKKHVLDSGRHPGLPLYVCRWCSPSHLGSNSVDSEKQRDSVSAKRNTTQEESVRKTLSAIVGFNSSVLAWRHLVTEHADILPTMEHCANRPSGTLKERDVTRIMGIYCPNVDHTKPPEGVAVQQPTIMSRHRYQSRFFSLITTKYGRSRNRSLKRSVGLHRSTSKVNIESFAPEPGRRISQSSARRSSSLVSGDSHLPGEAHQSIDLQDRLSASQSAPNFGFIQSTYFQPDHPLGLSESHTSGNSAEKIDAIHLDHSSYDFVSKTNNQYKRPHNSSNLIQIGSGALWSLVALSMHSDRIQQSSGCYTPSD